MREKNEKSFLELQHEESKQTCQDAVVGKLTIGIVVNDSMS